MHSSVSVAPGWDVGGSHVPTTLLEREGPLAQLVVTLLSQFPTGPQILASLPRPSLSLSLSRGFSARFTEL